jgi:outer membrane autotransporter protein
LINVLKSQPNEAATIAALNRLSPEHYLAQVEDTVQANLLFIDSMMSCPSADGRPNYIYEGQCTWAKVSGRSYDWDRTQSNIGGDTEGWTVAGGIQVALTETMRLGFAGSYEHTDITTRNAASSEGDRGEGGVVLKDRWGNTSFAVAAFGGYGSFETKRFIGLDGIDKAEGDQGIAFGGAHARVSHLLDQGGWYLKPMVDVDAIYVDYGDFREHGGGAANLAIQGNNDWVLSARPAIEIGSEFKANDGSFVRPYLRVGGLFFDDNSFAMTSTFMSAPDGLSPFTVMSRFDQSYFNVGAGLDLLTLSGINVKLNYEGLFAGHSDANSGGLKVGVKF